MTERGTGKTERKKGWIPACAGMTEGGKKEGNDRGESFLKYLLQLGEKWGKIAS